MGVTKVPGIWDYLGGALGHGVTNYQEALERVKQEHMRRLGLMTQLYGAGALDSADLTPALQKAGIQAKIQPNEAERQRSIIGSPDINPTTGMPWTEDERKIAGLPSRASQAKEAAEYTYLQGGPVTARQAAVLKLPTDLEIEQGAALAQDKTLSTIGPRYVDLAITQVGSVTPKNLNSIVDTAFNRYAADRRAAGLAVDPSHRSFFATQAVERLKDMENLRIQNINANKTYGGGGDGVSGRDAVTLYNAYGRTWTEANNVAETLRKDPIVMSKISHVAKHGDASPYAKDADVARYHQALQLAENARQAQAALGVGTPEAVKIMQGGQAAPTTQQPTLGGYSSGTPAPRGVNHQKAAEKILARKATIQQLAAEVQAGRMSANDYNTIRQLVIAGVKGGKK